MITKNEKWRITTDYRTATTDLRDEVITVFLRTFWHHSRSSCFFQSFFVEQHVILDAKSSLNSCLWRWFIQEPLVLERLLRAWKFQLSDDLVAFFEESRCLLDTFLPFECDCSTVSIKECADFDVKNSRHSRMSVANLKPFLGSLQRCFKVFFRSRLDGSSEHSRKIWEHRQNAEIIANAVWRAEDPPLHLEVERGQEHGAMQGLFVFNEISPDRAIGHTNFIPGFDQPWRVVDNGVCSFDLPKMNIWIARMVESGASKTNCWFVVQKSNGVQFKLFCLGSIFWT